jgi:hypothetical protein
MSHLLMTLFGKLRKVMAQRWLGVTSVVGGLALGLSALGGMFQSPHPSDTHVEIQRKALHDRVQWVRDALQTDEGAPVDRVVRSRLAQWYNWTDGWNNWRKWSNGWNNYWNNSSNK